jgi:AraC family transcriptional regulator
MCQPENSGLSAEEGFYIQSENPSYPRDFSSFLAGFYFLRYHWEYTRSTNRRELLLNYRIERHETMHLTGLSARVSTDQGRSTADIVAFWDMIRRDGTLNALCSAVAPGGRFECLGVYLDDYDMITHEYTYLVAIETPADPSGLPQGCVEVKAPAGTWAIFESTGPMPKAIQDVWKRIFQEWFPTSGYEHGPGPQMEVYPEGDTSSPDYYCEVWIPVKKASGK